MGSIKRFSIGGLGALMPILITLVAIDLKGLDVGAFNTGEIIGSCIRYIILFFIGGFIAYLHEDEQKPYKLFEIGIAAPALISSLITAQGVSVHGQTPTQDQAYYSIPSFFISSANADEFIRNDPGQIIYVADFLDDVIKGATGQVYRDQSSKQDKKPSKETEKKEDSNSNSTSQGQSPDQSNRPKTRDISSMTNFVEAQPAAAMQDKTSQTLEQELRETRLELELLKKKCKTMNIQ